MVTSTEKKGQKSAEFSTISAGTNEAFHRGNSTHATVIGVVLIDSMKAGF